MLTFVKRRAFRNSYGAATIDVMFDDEQGKFLHIIRRVVVSNGRQHENINRVVLLDDVSDEAANEVLNIAVINIIRSRPV